MTSRDRPIVPRVDTHGFREMAALAVERMTQLLAEFPLRATTAEIRFTDENGPKGGEDTRCTLTVKHPGHPPIHVGEVAVSARVAFDAAVGKLEWRLRRLRETERVNRRRPKKYFAAVQLWRAS
jgi:ribosome-associated translation inhibitor RaiA